MEGEDGIQQPQLVLANQRFLLSQNDVDDIEKGRLRDEVFKFIGTNDMAPLYETLIANKVLDLDQKALESMRAKIGDELKKLEENKKKGIDMPMKRHEAKGESSSHRVDSEEPKMDIKSILKDIEFLGTTHMTWKQKKDLENRKVVSLGGKAPKKQRLPLSVARVTMKKQKERDEKMLQESAILRRFGAYSSGSGGKKVTQRRRQEDRVLKSTQGDFRNGVLDVKHLLHPSAPRAADENSGHGLGKGKKRKGGKKGHGKRKGGGGKKRH